MSPGENPYQASDATLPAAKSNDPPLALKLTLGCYLASYLSGSMGDLLPATRSSVDFFIVATEGVYALVIGLCLWHRIRWVRIWVVISTLYAPALLAYMVQLGAWSTYPLATVSELLRIAVGCLLFVPSIRHWFTRRAPSSGSTSS